MLIMTFMTNYYPDLRNLRISIKSFCHLRKLITVLSFPGFVLLMLSCEEDPSKIGTGILPGRDFVSIVSTDTLSVLSYTRYEPSTRSDNQAYGLIGTVYNPYFGITTAEFVSQVRLGSRWGGETFAVDSVKLVLQIQSIEGDPAATQQLTISEIAEEIFTDSAYYSNTPVTLTGYDVATVEIPALRSDTVNRLEFALPLAFGNYILRDTSMLFHSNAKDDFRSYFRGLYFRVTSSTAHRMLTINLRRSSSTYETFYNYFIIYYHDESNTRKEYYLILDAKNPNARFNRYSHDFDAADPDKGISHLNEEIRDTVSYQQSLSGAFTRIVIPGLETIKKDPLMKNIAVNRARLTVPVYTDGNILTTSTTASQILLTYRLKGSSYYIPDYNINTKFFDGILDTANKVYNFNIVSYVQKYLEDTTDELKPELEMLISEGPGKNAVLKANDSSTPVKLNLTYTSF